MAWLTLDDQGEFTSHPQEPDLSTLSYWAMRLEPLIRAESDDEIIVVFANRCGTEGDTLYAGTSTVLGIRGGEVNVYGLLSRCEKKLLVVDTNQAPIAKLVMTPLGIRLVRSSSGGQGSPPQTTPSRSSARPGDGERRERGNSHDRSRDRVSTPSRPKEHKPTKEVGPCPAAYDSPGQSLHRLTPVPPIQHRSPALTPAKDKIQPPKLTIPDTGSRSWRKSDEAVTGTPVGPGRTPVRKKPKDPFSPQVMRPASKAPDSAVVLSAVERHRSGIFSPAADSAIGRATPEVRHRKSSRRSGEHRSSRHKEALKVDTAVPEEVTEEEQAAQRAQTLKDSPVARRPDSSVLSYWLETLPTVADLEPLPATPPVEPRAPSAGPEGSGGCTVCHACGQEVPKGDTSGVGSKNEKKRVSKAGAEGLGSKVLESGGPREGKGNDAFSHPGNLQNGVSAGSEGPRFDRTKGGEVRGGPLSQVEEGDEYVLQSRAFGAESTTGETREEERRSQDVAILLDPKVPGVSNGVIPGDANGDSHTAADDAVQQRRASPGVNSAEDKPAEPVQTNGAGMEDKAERAERAVQDALAPRTRIVPPSIKGMEKVVAVAIRPSSVAW